MVKVRTDFCFIVVNPFYNEVCVLKPLSATLSESGSQMYNWWKLCLGLERHSQKLRNGGR